MLLMLGNFKRLGGGMQLWHEEHGLRFRTRLRDFLLVVLG